MSFLDINNIFFHILGYAMSYVEFFGTLAGLIAVYLSARANAWSWSVGIINVILLFFLFFQVQLYPDMFLQVYFLITNLLGWWRWKHPLPGEADRKSELKISLLSKVQIVISLAFLICGTWISGTTASRLNEWLPMIFSKPSAYPFLDSFVLICSILAQYWMLHKKPECWILWILADVVATWLYFMKDIRFLSLEYLLFCFIAGYGWLSWIREKRTYSNEPTKNF
jgi:nicotinamide mononucleotide transporter